MTPFELVSVILAVGCSLMGAAVFVAVLAALVREVGKAVQARGSTPVFEEDLEWAEEQNRIVARRLAEQDAARAEVARIEENLNRRNAS